MSLSFQSKSNQNDSLFEFTKVTRWLNTYDNTNAYGFTVESGSLGRSWKTAVKSFAVVWEVSYTKNSMEPKLSMASQEISKLGINFGLHVAHVMWNYMENDLIRRRGPLSFFVDY